MNDYPEMVARIANDYLDRLRLQLRLVPPAERDEFLREIQSHIYEAYRQMPGENEVDRIFAVLRNLGEPAEVVSDRLPGAIVHSGSRHNLPVQILGGILIALFGIPLGFGGVAVLAGVLISLAGLVVAYYATVGAFLLSGGLFMVLGLTRLYRPELWDRLVALGFIEIDESVAGFFDQISPADQGLLLIVLAIVFVAVSLGMLKLGTRFVRGLRFLFDLGLDELRHLAEKARRKLRRDQPGRLRAPEVSFVK